MFNKKYFITLILVSSLTACSGGRNFANLTEQVANLQKTQADSNAEISSLNERIRNLNGVIQELEMKNSSSAPSFEVKQAEYFTYNLPISKDELISEKSYISHLTADQQSIIDSSINYLSSGENSKALFNLNIASVSNTDISLYLKGLLYSGDNNIKDSLDSYRVLQQNFKDSRYSRNSFLRQAEIFIKLGDVNTAKLTLNKLVSDYPNSNQASIAKIKLSELR